MCTWRHGIDTKEGKNKGNGTETLASYSGNYFEGKVVGGSVGLTGDGLNYNDTYFGEHVGDKSYVIIHQGFVGHGSILVLNENFPEGLINSWSITGSTGDSSLLLPTGYLYEGTFTDYFTGKYSDADVTIYELDENKINDERVIEYYENFKNVSDYPDGIKAPYLIKYDKKGVEIPLNMGSGMYYEFSRENGLSYSLLTFNCITIVSNAIKYGSSLSGFEVTKGSAVDLFNNWSNFKPSEFNKNSILKDNTSKEIFNGKMTLEELKSRLDTLKVDNKIKN